MINIPYQIIPAIVTDDLIFSKEAPSQFLLPRKSIVFKRGFFEIVSEWIFFNEFFFTTIVSR